VPVEGLAGKEEPEHAIGELQGAAPHASQ
jgi:hypothetical protein